MASFWFVCGIEKFVVLVILEVRSGNLLGEIDVQNYSSPASLFT